MGSKLKAAQYGSGMNRDKVSVVRCPGCGWVQFWAIGKTRCVRPECKHEITWRLTAKIELGAEKPLGEPAKLFDSQTLAERLRELRKARHLSQREAAEALGLRARTYLTKIENNRGAPTIKNIEKFAQAYQVRVLDLLDFEISVEDLATKSAAQLDELNAFKDELEPELLKVPRQEWDLVLSIAAGVASGQYMLPEWMVV